MHHSIVEIKAKCDNQEKIRQILKSHNADFKGVDHQIDTYFKANSGRLKLREGNIENHLIQYERADQTDPKLSQVNMIDVESGSKLKDILTNALGILAVVDKEREIYFIDNIKFHIDNVKNLDTFVEIEAIDSNEDNIQKLHEQCRYYLELFQISSDNLISNSYSDLLLGSPEAFDFRT